jgi:hypothetical protein
MQSFIKYTSNGLLFKVWREEPSVPRIDDRFLDCSVYLYPTKDDAARGIRIGGTGFSIAVDSIVAKTSWDSESNKEFFYYAVSNRHVVQKSPIVRLNTHDGKFDVIALQQDDWVWTDTNDLAVAPITFNEAHKYLFISNHAFLTKGDVAKFDIGIGDEIFMVGRFISHDGRQRNSPSIRWGHVAMMSTEMVWHETNKNNEQESFLVEVHSISGYSGSPVFVRPFNTAKLFAVPEVSNLEDGRRFKAKFAGPWLLGVDWGYINTHDQTKNNTGISGVVPVWSLLDLLNTEKLQMQRKKEQDEKAAKAGGSTLTSEEHEPLSMQEFEQALKKASRRLPQETPESDREKPRT